VAGMEKGARGERSVERGGGRKGAGENLFQVFSRWASQCPTLGSRVGA
jgi:hypothetical protein